MEVNDWDIRREGRKWTRDETEHWFSHAPDKIEYVGGIFAGENQRLLVMGMLLELLGIDKVVRFGKIADWKAAIADLEQQLKSESRSERD